MRCVIRVSSSRSSLSSSAALCTSTTPKTAPSTSTGTAISLWTAVAKGRKSASLPTSGTSAGCRVAEDAPDYPLIDAHPLDHRAEPGVGAGNEIVAVAFVERDGALPDRDGERVDEGTDRLVHVDQEGIHGRDTLCSHPSASTLSRLQNIYIATNKHDRTRDKYTEIACSFLVCHAAHRMAISSSIGASDAYTRDETRDAARRKGTMQWKSARTDRSHRTRRCSRRIR